MNDEVLEVIASTSVAVLATLNEDGSPYAVPITYKFDDGVFTWVSAPDTVHSHNIERDQRISLNIVENSSGKSRGVYINSVAVATGEKIFNEQWEKELAKYQISLGKLDKQKSTEGRFYFHGEAK